MNTEKLMELYQKNKQKVIEISNKIENLERRKEHLENEGKNKVVVCEDGVLIHLKNVGIYIFRNEDNLYITKSKSNINDYILNNKL